MIKNPYLYSYLPLITIVLFSLTFGLYSVNEAVILFHKIGVYAGMHEFLSDVQMRILLLIVFALIYFMIFSALKLIGETIHDVGMLFFTKDRIDQAMENKANAGVVIFFFGALASVAGLVNVFILVGIFLLSAIFYFIFVTYKLSDYLSFGSILGIMLFEMTMWILLLTLVVYAIFKLYNGIVSSLPFN